MTAAAVQVTVVGVHGVGNFQASLQPGPAAQRLSGWWSDALTRGFGTVGGFPPEVQVAYYADLLHAHTALGTVPPEALPKPVQDDIVEWAQHLGAPSVTQLGRVTAPVRAAISWVADRFGLDQDLTRAFASRFFSEVDTYFTQHDRRQRARARVASTITEVRPQVLIAHSLGSVVAYEALWAHEHPPIDLLLTLGSPLAMPDIVFHRLADHDGHRRRPPGVRRWINLSDPGDIVAIPAHGIPRAFKDITADLVNVIHAFDFHRATHYLANPVTVSALASVI